MTDPTFANTQTHRVETHNARSVIVDGPTLTGVHVSRQKFVADAISAMWQRIDAGKWTLYEFRVSGPLVLKHGELSTKTRLNLHLANLPRDLRPDWANTWLDNNGP